MHGWWAASYVALWILVIALCVLVVALARQIGTLHLRLGPRGALEMDDEGPPLGEAPPALTVLDSSGHPFTVGGPGGPRVLLFVSPGCSLCEQVLPGLGAVAAAGGMVPVVVADVDPEEGMGPQATLAPSPLLYAPEVVRAYDVPGTPFGVVLDHAGAVRAKGTPNNLEQMEGLIETGRRRMRDPEQLAG